MDNAITRCRQLVHSDHTPRLPDDSLSPHRAVVWNRQHASRVFRSLYKSPPTPESDILSSWLGIGKLGVWRRLTFERRIVIRRTFSHKTPDVGSNHPACRLLPSRNRNGRSTTKALDSRS
jgi:hypothetical protein